MTKHESGFVRGYSDGTAELRRTEEGALARYLIGEDGSVEPLEIAPQSLRNAWGMVLGYGGFAVFGVSLGAGFFGEAVNWGPAVHPTVVVVGMSVGLITGFVSVASWPRATPVPGERWKHLGPSND